MAPQSGITARNKAFTDQLKVSGSYGAVTFTQSTGKPSVTVSSTGVVSAPGSLSGGIYKATGTATDRFGDIRGAWTFSLTVSGAKLGQLAPTTAQISTGKGFTTQLKVSGSRGSLIFTEASGAPALKVSPSGTLTAQSDLAKGVYTASGTDNDSSGDSGNWSFTLTVTSGTIKPTTLKQVGADSADTTGRAGPTSAISKSRVCAAPAPTASRAVLQPSRSRPRARSRPQTTWHQGCTRRPAP